MIDPALVQQIAACYGNTRDNPARMSYLRDCFPDIRFTYCNADEIDRAKPVMECNGFNLYLVGGEHCLSLTGNYDDAKGIVVADVDNNDE